MLQIDAKYVTQNDEKIASLLNPPLQSKILQRFAESTEEIYSSEKKAPVGKTHQPAVPIKNLQESFGLPTGKGLTAVELMYPFEVANYQSVYSDAFSFKKPLDLLMPAGLKLNHLDNSGEQMNEIFHPNAHENSTAIVPSSYAKKLNFDKKCYMECFNLCNDILPNDFKTGDHVKKFRQALKDRNSVEALWNLLKKKNHTNFKDLLSSFKTYQDADGRITIHGLQQMCEKLGISVPLHVIEKLFEECDIIDNDGTLTYEEFIHGLNWKLLPENSNFKTSKYKTDWREGMNNPPKDVLENYKTTYSFIGDHKHSVKPQAAGMPSFLKEGDQSSLEEISKFNKREDAASIIQPHSFSKYGVFKEDLSILYPKEKIKSILIKSGIKFNNEMFEMVWLKENQNGEASIGTMWNALKNICLDSFKYI